MTLENLLLPALVVLLLIAPSVMEWRLSGKISVATWVTIVVILAAWSFADHVGLERHAWRLAQYAFSHQKSQWQTTHPNGVYPTARPQSCEIEVPVEPVAFLLFVGLIALQLSPLGSKTRGTTAITMATAFLSIFYCYICVKDL